MTVQTEPTTETETPAVRWPLADGHRLRVTLTDIGPAWELICPHGTPTEGNLANAPLCRIERDDEGEPVDVYPTCLLLEGWEGPEDNLHRPRVGVDIMLADLPIAWDWPLEEALEVYPAELDAADGITADRIRYAGMSPIKLRDAALQLLGERDRARRTAVELEQQVAALTRLIGQTSTVISLGGHHSAAREMVRRCERIVNPFASEGPTDMADRLHAEMAALPPGDSADCGPGGIDCADPWNCSNQQHYERKA